MQQKVVRGKRAKCTSKMVNTYDITAWVNGSVRYKKDLKCEQYVVSKAIPNYLTCGFSIWSIISYYLNDLFVTAGLFSFMEGRRPVI